MFAAGPDTAKAAVGIARITTSNGCDVERGWPRESNVSTRNAWLPAASAGKASFHHPLASAWVEPSSISPS